MDEFEVSGLELDLVPDADGAQQQPGETTTSDTTAAAQGATGTENSETPADAAQPAAAEAAPQSAATGSETPTAQAGADTAATGSSQAAGQQADQQTPGGPNADFAARRAAAEARRNAEEAARKKLFLEMTAGINDPKTGKPFETEEAFAAFKNEARVNSLASSAGLKPNQISGIVEQVRQEAEAAAVERFKNSAEYRQMQAQTEQMRQQAIERQFGDDMAEIRAAYPDEQAGSVQELGEQYMRLRAQGVDNLVAYAALRRVTSTKNAAKNPTTGDVKSAGEPKRDWLTQAEVDKMTDAEMDQNLDKIMESMKHWT